MNNKFIRSLAILSTATLLLGACAGSNNKGNNSSDNPVPPTPSEGEFKLPETLDEAKIFEFRDLVEGEEEEEMALVEAFLEGVNKVDARLEMMYDDSARNQMVMRIAQEGTVTFFAGEYVESEFKASEDYYYMGSYDAQESGKSTEKEQAIVVDGFEISRNYSTYDHEDSRTHWSKEVASPIGQREGSLNELLMMCSSGVSYAGIKKVNETTQYIVFVEYSGNYSSTSDYLGDSFYYYVESYQQNIIEVKDNKIVAATMFREEKIDHNLLTGEMLKEPVVSQKMLYKFDLNYGEVTESPNKETFAASLPEWVISEDAYDAGVYGYCYNSVRSTDPNEGPTLLNEAYFNAYIGSRKFLENGDLELEVQIQINVDGSKDDIAVVPFAYDEFNPILNAATSSDTFEAEISWGLGGELEKVDTAVSLAGWGSYDHVIIVPKDTKYISFKMVIPFDDSTFEHVTFSEVALEK